MAGVFFFHQTSPVGIRFGITVDQAFRSDSDRCHGPFGVPSGDWPLPAMAVTFRLSTREGLTFAQDPGFQLCLGPSKKTTDLRRSLPFGMVNMVGGSSLKIESPNWASLMRGQARGGRSCLGARRGYHHIPGHWDLVGDGPQSGSS